MTLRASVSDLRARAARCLADEAPAPAEAHALARAALVVVAQLDAVPATPGHPYRSPAAGEGSAPDVATLVALERALEDCQARLRVARAEIESLRKRPGPA